MSLNEIYSLKLCGEPLKNWQDAFGHNISITQEGELKVFSEGRYQNWNELKPKIIDPKKSGRISSNWRYDQHGLSPISYIKFKELVPSMTHHNSNGQCYLEIKTKETGFMGLSRHTYAELIDADGKGYKFGMCGPTSFPFYGTKGSIVSPDPKEATKGKERKIRIIISKDQLDMLIERVTQDKLHGKEYFHLINQNCGRYITKLCEEILDLYINHEEYASEALFRQFLSFVKLKPSQNVLFILNVLLNSLTSSLAPISGILWLLLGFAFDDARGAKAKLFEPINLPKNRFERLKHLHEKLEEMASGRCFKVVSGWKLSVWQDNLIKLYGSNEISLQQARSYRLDDNIAIRC